MVVWIIGLSGAGKSTLAEATVSKLRTEGRSVVLVDGDEVREVFGNDIGHDLEDRRVNASRICRLCQLMERNQVDVVCAVLSIFPESREWCRQNLDDYYEVYIEAPLSELKYRDSKGIYGRFESGEIVDVAGLDLDFPIPSAPDLHIKNVGSIESLLLNAQVITQKILGN